MNKTTSLLLSGLLTASFSASGAIVAGWDDWSNVSGTTYTAAITNGVTAEATGTSAGDSAGWGYWSNDIGRSGDGTWGTQAVSPLPSTSIAVQEESIGLRNSESAGDLTITITNTSGAALDLTSFHFDAISRFTDAPDTWALSILAGSAVTEFADFASGSIENVSSFGARAAEGYDIDLSSLTDTTFENGESVIFELAFTGGVVASTSGGHNMMMDNMAIVAVPEPSVFALISGLGVLGLVLYRRSRD